MKRTDKKIPLITVYKVALAKKIILFLLAVFVAVLYGQTLVFAEEVSASDVSTRYGMTMAGGNSYDPQNNISFVQLSGFVLFDHEKIFPHKTPEALRFKVEGSIGSTTRPEKRFVANVNIFSLYYIDALSTKTFKLYAEGGIGGIYMDYRWKGQDARFNFNPQLGVGTEIDTGSGSLFLMSLRLHHVSNAGLNKHNRGLNSVAFSIGRFF